MNFPSTGILLPCLPVGISISILINKTKKQENPNHGPKGNASQY
jgi:hypothetical protein